VEPKLTWVNCGLCVDERGAVNDEHGIDKQRCVAAAQPIRRADIADLLEEHDQIGHW
jgi:hypothetical protein